MAASCRANTEFPTASQGNQKFLENHGIQICVKLPVVKESMCERLKVIIEKQAADSLAVSPVAKDNAPAFKGVNDAMAYSKSEPPKNHTLSKVSKIYLLDMVAIR